jgi:glucosamine 6-phosphate synthetase-like amidotransferase/phosphosugar isomerase protein
MNQTRGDFPNRLPVSVETMLLAVRSQAELIPALIDHLRPQVRKVVAELKPERMSSVFAVGCGDSLYASMATRLAFDKYSGFRMEPIEALEFSRYAVDYIPKESLVIGISSGGRTSRPVEAMRHAKRVGAYTVAVTGSPDSPIAAESDLSIFQNEADFRVPAPPGEGTFALGNYLAAMIGMYLIALELGRAKAGLAPAEQELAISEITRAAQIIGTTIEANDQPVSEFARIVRELGTYYILGGGPSYATALFMAAKLFEMPQSHGVPIELEEWAHEQFFLTRSGTTVLIVAPLGRSVSRAREQIVGAKDMGARVAVICDEGDHETQRLADVSFPIVGALKEEFSPLTYCVPGELFAAHLCRAMNKPAFSFISIEQFNVNKRQVSHSQIE